MDLNFIIKPNFCKKVYSERKIEGRGVFIVVFWLVDAVNFSLQIWLSYFRVHKPFFDN